MLWIAGMAPAQDELGSRILAAAKGKDYPQQLRTLGCDKLPVSRLLDALTEVGPGPGHDWDPHLDLLFHERVEDLHAAWRDEPAARRPRRALFARFADLDWIGMHARAGEEERAEIEALAAELPPRWYAGAEYSLRPDPPSPESAATLLRIYNRSAPDSTGATDWLASMRRTRGTPDELQSLQFYNVPEGVRPYALTALFDDANPIVRLRASVLLRRVLNMPLTPWLRVAVATDPAPGVDSLIGPEPLTDADVPLLCR